MTADELVTVVTAAGASLRLEGRRLFVGPAGRVSEALLSELRAHREALVDLVGGAVRLQDVLGGDVKPTADIPATTSAVLSMPLSSFARAGLVVPVQSRHLGIEILLASDDTTLDPGERRHIFRAAELDDLHRLGPGALDLAHELKQHGCAITIN